MPQTTTGHGGTGSAPRMRRKLVIWGGSAAAVALTAGTVAMIAGAGRSSPSPQASRSRTGGPIDVFTVVKSTFDVTTTASGELRARQQTDIRNEIEGDETTILEIIPEGTFVKPGDLLVRLNAERIQTRLDDEDIDLKSARGAVLEAEEALAIQRSENESLLSAAELKVVIAELDLKQWQEGDDKVKKLDLEHAVDRTRKDEERLREKFEKSTNLFSRGFYSKDLLRQDELSWEQSEASRDKAVLDQKAYLEYERVKEEKKRLSDLDEARAELARVKAQNKSRENSKVTDLDTKQDILTRKNDVVEKLRRQIGAAEIKAPTGGLVVYASSMESGRWGGGDEGPLTVGSKVWPNQTIIILPDTTEMIAAVRVHESLAGRIRPGLPATVKVDAAGDRRFTGTVESIGIMAEQTNRWMDPNVREYTVRIRLDTDQFTGGSADQSHDPTLKPSMRCEAEVSLGRVDDAITVPIQAVFNEGVLRYVCVADLGGRYVKRPVLPGKRSDRFAEIKAGLNVGDRVLLRKPEVGELSPRQWDAKELATVGLHLDEQGQISPIPGAPPAERGEGTEARGRGNRRGPRPDAPALPGAAEAKAEPTEKVESGEAPAAEPEPASETKQ